MPEFIQLKTSVPGPRSEQLLKIKESELPEPAYNLTPIFVERAKGALVTDIDGNTYIDFGGGIGVLNVGHANENVVAAVKVQVEKFTHTCFHLGMYQLYVDLARKLNQLTPGDFKKKTMFANSGAEAIENAVKIARHYTRRPAIVCFEHAFHGRTLLGMSLTGKIAPYKKGFGPMATDIYRLPFPYCYRCPYGLEPETCETYCAQRLNEFFITVVDAETVAAVIMEPILGEGGFVPVPQTYFQKLIEFCRRKDILFIADEIQTGWGRTGKLFAVEHYNAEPDIIITGKSLAGGMPLSSFTGRAEIMDEPQLGGLGGTFSGNPVCCAAALAAVDFIEKNNLANRAVEIGSIVKPRFLAMKEKYSIIGDVRGVGAMNALELVTDRKRKTPATEQTIAIIKQCYQNGLFVLKAGTYNNVIRTLMPLVITNEQLLEGLDVLESVIAAQKI